MSIAQLSLSARSCASGKRAIRFHLASAQSFAQTQWGGGIELGFGCLFADKAQRNFVQTQLGRHHPLVGKAWSGFARQTGKELTLEEGCLVSVQPPASWQSAKKFCSDSVRASPPSSGQSFVRLYQAERLGANNRRGAWLGARLAFSRPLASKAQRSFVQTHSGEVLGLRFCCLLAGKVRSGFARLEPRLL